MIIYSLSSSLDPANIRYIGLTKKLEKVRLREHVSESRYLRTHKDKWIQKVIRLGGKVIFSIVETCSAYSELREREKFWICYYRSLGFKLTNGTDGGDSSEGYIRTPEQRRVNGLANRRTVFVFDYKTKEFLYRFNSIRETVKRLDLSITQVNYVLSGDSNYHKGYTFSKTSECPKEIIRIQKPAWNKGLSTKGRHKHRSSPVVISDDSLDIEFDTVGEASKFIGCSHTQISGAVKRGFYKKWKVAYLKGLDKLSLVDNLIPLALAIRVVVSKDNWNGFLSFTL